MENGAEGVDSEKRFILPHSIPRLRVNLTQMTGRTSKTDIIKFFSATQSDCNAKSFNATQRAALTYLRREQHAQWTVTSVPGRTEQGTGGGK